MPLEELEQVGSAYVENVKHVMVDFNCRFTPQVQLVKWLLVAVKAPKRFVMVMNVGLIPSNYLIQDPTVGGVRVIGKARDYIELMRSLAGLPMISVQARRMGDTDGEPVTDDKASITLGFADGAFGSIHYLANGRAYFPKERAEVFTAGRLREQS